MATNLIGKLKTIIDHYQSTENQLNQKLKNLENLKVENEQLKAENEQLKVYEQRCIALESVIGELKSSQVEMQLKLQRQKVDLQTYQTKKNNNFLQAIKSNQLGSGSGMKQHERLKQQSEQLANLNSAHKRTKDELIQSQIRNGRLKSELKKLKNMANAEVIEVESDTYREEREELKKSNVGNYHIFVGDLSPEIENQTLWDAFATFGEIL